MDRRWHIPVSRCGEGEVGKRGLEGAVMKGWCKLRERDGAYGGGDGLCGS